jgi:hypothetical protein
MVLAAGALEHPGESWRCFLANQSQLCWPQSLADIFRRTQFFGSKRREVADGDPDYFTKDHENLKKRQIHLPKSEDNQPAYRRFRNLTLAH